MDLKIGSSIKRLRLERDMTQEELAQKIGVTFQAISKWETNTTTPDIALLPKLSILFGVSIDELFAVNDSDYMDRIDSMIRDDHTISNENFIWAERYLKGYISENPKDNRARNRLVELYGCRINRYSLAQGRYAEEGILTDPMDVDLNKKLLRVRESRIELDRYIAFIEPLVKKYPKNYVIIECLLAAYIKQRYFNKAKELIGKSEPRAAYELILGDIELGLGNVAKAKEIWIGVADTHSNDGWALFESAERFNKAGDYDTAISIYEKSYDISPSPKWMDSLYARVFLYEKLGKYQEAIAMWETIIDVLAKDYHITEGETVDWPKRELDKLRKKI